MLLLLVLPMAGFALTALVGRRLGTRAWIIAVPAIIVVWLIAMYLVYQALVQGAFGEEGITSRSTSGSRPATSRSTSTSCVDNLTAVMLHRGHHRGHAGPRLLHRLHGPRPGPLALLRLPEPVHVQHAAAGPGGNFLLLFAAWELVGLSSYLLIGFWYRKRSRGAGRQEGVPGQPRRRLRLRAGHHGHLDDGRHAQLHARSSSSCRRQLLSGRDRSRG